MMKHSILTKLKRKKSTSKKVKKTVHWCEQLEQIYVYTPESENMHASDDWFLSSSQNSSSDLQHDHLPKTSQPVTTTEQATSELQRKLEKLYMDNIERTRFTVNNRPVWRKIVGAENSSLEGEDWVWWNQ